MTIPNGSISELSDEQKLAALPDALDKAYLDGVSDGKIEIYETERIHLVKEGNVEFQIHLLPTLNSKPKPSPNLPDLLTPPSSLSPPKRDPFSPPFPPEELIVDLEHYHVILNKFCFLPEQFVLATRRWAVQQDHLEEQDLWAAYEVLKAFGEAGKPLLMFYNCGNRSAASQAHRHVQFVPFQQGEAPPTEKLALSLDLQTQTPTPLPLPYLHLTTPLSSKTQLTPSSLHALCLSSLAHHPPSSTSHNLLLTLDHLHTVPRSERDVHLTLDSKNEGEEEERKLTLGPNGLGFAGMFFVKPGDEGILERWGVGEVLKGVGYASEEEEVGVRD